MTHPTHPIRIVSIPPRRERPRPRGNETRGLEPRRADPEVHATNRIPLVSVIALLALVPAPGRDRAEAAGPHHKLRGVIISTHTDGRDWGSPAMRSTMRDIREVGADWVCIHPYAEIAGDGNVRSWDFDPLDPPEWLTRPIEDAHALGLKILIKPHLAYWGSPFAWRGDIAFTTDAQWRRFFTGYTTWIVNLADACRNADGFVVGTELDSTLSHEKEWREVIARVREHTGVPLTYGANWTHYRQVPFWDALDVIGIQAYFPLVTGPGADSAQVGAGWGRLMRELHAFAGREHKKIVFTELGYNRAYDAPVRPWDYRVDGPDAEGMQAMCLRIALDAVEGEPSVIGVFLWKWFPNPYPVGRNFQLATPYLKSVISQVWSG